MAIEDMLNHPRPAARCVQILRLPQVCKVTGLGRSMIYQLESARRFPCRVRIGVRDALPGGRTMQCGTDGHVREVGWYRQLPERFRYTPAKGDFWESS